MKSEIIPKPITLLREDFISELLELCNHSALPYFVMEDILKDILDEVHIASQRQLESDKAKYAQVMNNTVSEKDGG